MNNSDQKNPHVGHRKRLRYKAKMNGLSGFHQHEVVELLLTLVIPRRDVNPLAHALIDRFGSLDGVLNATESELCEVHGIGEKSARFLSVLRDFVQYFEEDCARTRILLSNPRQSKEYLRAFSMSHSANVVWQFNLDVHDRLICAESICSYRTGIGNCIREICQSALDCGAKSIWFGCRTEHIDRHFREEAMALQAVSEQMWRIGVFLAEYYLLVGDDVYSALGAGERGRILLPRSSEYETILRERPKRQ